MVYSFGGGAIKSSVFRAVIIVALFSILTRILGFLFRIYLSRELGAELLGVYQVAFSVFMVFIVIVASGLPLTVSKQTAKYKVTNNASGMYGTVSGALIIGAVVAILICGVFIVFKDYITKMFADARTMDILLTLLPAVVFSAVYSAFRGSLWGTKNYFFVSFSEFIEQVARILFFIVLAKFIFPQFNGAYLAGVSMSLGCFISMLFMVGIYFFNRRKLTNPQSYLKPIIKSALPITGVRAATSLIQPLIAVLFPLMLVISGHSTEQAMSLYGIAMGMAFPLLFLPSTIVGAMSFTLIPDLSVSIAQNNSKDVEQKIRSNIFFTMLISVLFIPFFVGAGPQICQFLYNNTLAGVYLSKSAIVMLPLGLSNITSSILNTLNLEVRSFVHNIIGGIVLILCVIGLSWCMGVDALILGFGLCMTVTSVMNLIKIKHSTNIKLNILKPLFCMALFLVPSAILCNFVCGIATKTLNLFWGVAFGCVISVICFIVLCWTFKLLDVVSIVCKFLPKKCKKVHNL